MKRLNMTITLASQARVALDGVRCPLPTDQPALAQLMLDAYRGTVDDEGETLAQALIEVERTFDGGYGVFMPQCSKMVEYGARAASATLVTRWGGWPLVAFAMTAPDYRRQGLARACLVNTMQDLMDSGETRLNLVVTAQNTPAFLLYRTLGFQVCEDFADVSSTPLPTDKTTTTHARS